ncbi:MAG: acyltransferase [Nocardiaceae bacterium]|nr:acyltransferase [Nocardiaceae bacterium]
MKAPNVKVLPASVRLISVGDFRQQQHFWVWLANTPLVGGFARARVLRRAGVAADKQVLISHGFVISGEEKVVIGEGSFINCGCYFDTVAEVRLGRKVFVADHVRFLTTTHAFGGPDRRAGAGIAKPVLVGDGTWIGSGTVIMPGVTIGEGCIIGANSLITKDCEPNGIYVGSPAKRVRDLDERPTDREEKFVGAPEIPARVIAHSSRRLRRARTTASIGCTTPDAAATPD